MARTWDTVSTYSTAIAFTTARSYSHTVGGGPDRGIFCGLATEDFSTGGGAQTPSSVAYGGNALTLDSIAKVSSIQTAALYSGQDSVCGSAGAHNMVITYAGEVDAIVSWTASADNIAQQVKEATGTVQQLTSVSSGTVPITTLTNESLIIAVAGEDEGTAGSGGTVGHSWNVGTELGDLSNSRVGGSMVRYEKATAGAQSMIDTLTEGVTRLCMVACAYETINSTPPVVSDISNQSGSFGVEKSVACTLTKGTSDISRCDVSTDGTCLITLTASGSATITNNGTTAPYVTGTNADIIATLGNGIKLNRNDYWTDPEVPPILTYTETITVLATDTEDDTGSDMFDMVWSVDSGNGTLMIGLSDTTISGINAKIADSYYIPTADFTGRTYLYVIVTDDNGNTDEVIIPIDVVSFRTIFTQHELWYASA